MEDIKNPLKKKEFKQLSNSLFLSLLETAIIHKKMNLDDLENKKLKDYKDILLDMVKDCSDESGGMNFTIAYTEEILKEANSLKSNGKYRLALILYATAIEHHLNEIIQRALLNKIFKTSEIESIMRLDIDSKRTWLFPLLGLPRLSENCSKNIKSIADKRNEFIHYKWKGLFDDESEKLNNKYLELCNKAPKVISVIKRYKTKNLVTVSKIKKILKEKKQSAKK